MHDYETIRLRNLEDNRRVLASFGLLDPFKSLPRVIKQNKKPVLKSSDVKRKLPVIDGDFVGGSVYGTRRKSARLEKVLVWIEMDKYNLFMDWEWIGNGRNTKKTKSSIYLPKNTNETVFLYDCRADGFLTSLALEEVTMLRDLDYNVSYEELDTHGDDKPVRKVPSNRPNFYGAIPGVEVGTVWATRMECCRDGVHRPTVAGIHGGEDGAYSIALSGGYEDDVDLGDCFTYTGEGGRDLKGTKSNPKNLRTAPQSRDQALTRGNLALSKNVETKNPVRVIRGYKLASPFAPEEGYRYDGLYTVEKCWFITGLSGFGVWKFALRRCPNQDPSPWQFSVDSSLLTCSPKAAAPCTHQADTDDQRQDDAMTSVAEAVGDAAAETVECTIPEALGDKSESINDTSSKRVLQEISVDSSTSAAARKRGRNKKVNGSC